MHQNHSHWQSDCEGILNVPWKLWKKIEKAMESAMPAIYSLNVYNLVLFRARCAALRCAVCLVLKQDDDKVVSNNASAHSHMHTNNAVRWISGSLRRSLNCVHFFHCKYFPNPFAIVELNWPTERLARLFCWLVDRFVPFRSLSPSQCLRIFLFWKHCWYDLVCVRVYGSFVSSFFFLEYN